MGIGESLKEKKGCVFFFILFRFADTISSEKELKGLDLSCPHFPFMSYIRTRVLLAFIFLEKIRRKGKKEKCRHSFPLSRVETLETGHSFRYFCR